jgi:peroxiredoxin
MKKLFTLLSLVIIFTSFAYVSEYTVNAKVKGIGGKVYLAKVVNDQLSKIDSTIIEDGKFLFRGSVTKPELYFLLFENNKKAQIQFIVENSDIKITADLGSKNAPVVKGSSQHDILNNFDEVMKAFKERSKNMQQDYGVAKQANDETKMEVIVNDYNAMEKEKKHATKNYIKKHKSSFAAAVIVSKQRLNEVEDIDNILSVLDIKLLKLDILKGIKEKANKLKKVALEKTAPDFTLNDTEGKAVNLSSLYGKGYILIDFWASWCGPCRAENPHVVEAYNEFKDRGFEIVGVSLDRANVDGWKKAIADDKLTWIQLIDWTNGKAAVADMYAVTGIPMNFLLNKKGKIIAKGLRGKALKEKLGELIK